MMDSRNCEYGQHPTCPRFLFRCDRKATVERDGVRFCWQHDPERRKRIAQERRDKQRAEDRAREAKWDAADRRRKLEDEAGITGLTDSHLQAIIKLGGIQALIK